MAEGGELPAGGGEEGVPFSFMDKVRFMMYGEQEKEAFLIEKKEKEEKKKAKALAKAQKAEEKKKKKLLTPSVTSPDNPKPDALVPGDEGPADST